MGALGAIFLIYVFVLGSQSTIISRKFIPDHPELDDKISNAEFLIEFNSTSKIGCAARCQRECSFFGFNTQIKKCRTHREIFTTGMSNERGWRYYSHDFIPIDCKDLHANGYTNSGVFKIYPYVTITSPVTVFCDMTTMGGGWTAIQKRVNGSLSFDRNWTEYKNGFGAPEQDYWVGNDVIHQLTKENNTFLYVTIKIQDSARLYEMYDRFLVSNETKKYQLFVAGPATGTLGDAMLNTVNPGVYLSGMYFTTKDRDNDKGSSNCANHRGIKGGWWFHDCHWAFLNGPWSPKEWGNPWAPRITSGLIIKETMMLIKRHQ